jgi:hypothetical protein
MYEHFESLFSQDLNHPLGPSIHSGRQAILNYLYSGAHVTIAEDPTAIIAVDDHTLGVAPFLLRAYPLKPTPPTAY